MPSELAICGADMAEFLAAVLERDVPFRFTAHGSSMHPFIRDGDVITVSPLRSRAPRLGEVVAFRGRGGWLVVHRVVAAKAGTFVLGGDARSVNDGHISLESMLGVVVRVERHGRPVRLGIGHGGTLVAVLSRSGALRPLVACVRLPWRAARAVLRRSWRLRP